MQIKLNGKTEDIADNAELKDILLKYNIPQGYAVFEVNGEIISGNRAAGLRLSENDVVEVIRFMGGG